MCIEPIRNQAQVHVDMHSQTDLRTLDPPFFGGERLHSLERVDPYEQPLIHLLTRKDMVAGVLYKRAASTEEYPIITRRARSIGVEPIVDAKQVMSMSKLGSINLHKGVLSVTA